MEVKICVYAIPPPGSLTGQAPENVPSQKGKDRLPTIMAFRGKLLNFGRVFTGGFYIPGGCLGFQPSTVLEPYLWPFYRWVHYTSQFSYSLYRWGFLHFRYLKCLVILRSLQFPAGYWKNTHTHTQMRRMYEFFTYINKVKNGHMNKGKCM